MTKKNNKKKNKRAKDDGKRMKKKEMLRLVMTAFQRSPGLIMNYKQVSKQIGAENQVQKLQVASLLEKMKESGILKEVDRGRYQYNHVVTSLTGTFVRRSNGRNSFLPDDGSEAIAIAERDSAHAMDGDKVRVQLFARRKNQEPEGEVVEILESKERVFVGKLQVQNGLSFLITEDRTLANDIFIPRDTTGVTSWCASSNGRRMRRIRWAR